MISADGWSGEGGEVVDGGYAVLKQDCMLGVKIGDEGLNVGEGVG